MAITRRAPNTIHLGGPITRVNEYVAIESITPGMLLEGHNDSGAFKWGVHDSADAAAQRVFALEQISLNKGVADPYAAGDLVEAAIFLPGSTVWAIIPSGQDIAMGDMLQSNGDGKVKELGSGQAIGVSLDAPGAVTVDTRIRMEVI